MLGTKRVEAVIVSWLAAYGSTVQDSPLILFKFERQPQQIVHLERQQRAASLGRLKTLQARTPKSDQGPATGDHASSAYHARLGRHKTEECGPADQQRAPKVQPHSSYRWFKRCPTQTAV